MERPQQQQQECQCEQQDVHGWGLDDDERGMTSNLRTTGKQVVLRSKCDVDDGPTSQDH